MRKRNIGFFMRLKKLAWRAVAPVSSDEDTRRREFILHILLLASIILLTLAVVSSSIASISETSQIHQNDSMPIVILATILFAFFGLYALSINGRSKTSALILLGIFFLLSLYLAYRWGPDLPTALLFYALTIVMAGVLISSRFAFFVTLSFVVLIPLIDHMQDVGILSLNSYWRGEPLILIDTLVISFMLLIIATVSWLSNRETEASLLRARRSEAALTEERNMLEIRVEERTLDLRMAEMEKLRQSYRFVEFGRLASGIFHDLANPLAALSLNIESIEKSHGTTDPRRVAFLTEDVARARNATIHMQKLLDSMRKHLARQGTCDRFSVSDCVTEIVHALGPYAQEHLVVLSAVSTSRIRTYGDSIAFVQVLTNLISNAIESFPPEISAERRAMREVAVSAATADGTVSIIVKDTGSGIETETLQRIFEPFFSTKDASDGLGIGLSLAKQIVEREFEGTLSVASVVGKGTTFTIYFPIREP